MKLNKNFRLELIIFISFVLLTFNFDTLKIGYLIIRILIGLLLLFASITFFFKLIPEPLATGNMKVFNEGLKVSIYLMPLVKIVELLCGISYISGRYVALANILLLPVTLNILLINIFLMPEGIVVALPLFLGNIFLIYKHWHDYNSIFVTH